MYVYPCAETKGVDLHYLSITANDSSINEISHFPQSHMGGVTGNKVCSSSSGREHRRQLSGKRTATPTPATSAELGTKSSGLRHVRELAGVNKGFYIESNWGQWCSPWLADVEKPCLGCWMCPHCFCCRLPETPGDPDSGAPCIIMKAPSTKEKLLVRLVTVRGSHRLATLWCVPTEYFPVPQGHKFVGYGVSPIGACCCQPGDTVGGVDAHGTYGAHAKWCKTWK